MMNEHKPVTKQSVYEVFQKSEILTKCNQMCDLNRSVEAEYEPKSYMVYL